MVGGLVMTHSDDNGLVTPPLLAPIEVVIVPIYRTDEDRARVLETAERLRSTLGSWDNRSSPPLRIHIDSREGMKPGAKYYEWELRGIPLRMEIGPRDLDANQAVLVRRDTREKKAYSLDTIGADIAALLSTMQTDLFEAARERRERNSIRGDVTYDRFREIMAGDGAFVYAGWCGSAACEGRIKEETKATIRVLPDEEFRSEVAPTHCLLCGEPAVAEALWAKAY
jgi:prolyl-tRNA synthetase